MTEPRIIPPGQARALLKAATPGPWDRYARDLAHTAAVLGEQRAAVLALLDDWLDHGSIDLVPHVQELRITLGAEASDEH